MKRATDQEFTNHGRFQTAIGNVLALAQLLAMMPVIGVTKPSASQLRFEWKSVRAIYTAIIFTLAAAYLFVLFVVTLSNQMTFNSVGECLLMNYI